MIGKLLVLIAVLLMPLGMQPAAAAASHRHAQAGSMPMRHCPEQAPRDHSRGGFAECTMACSAALPAVDLAPEERPVVAAAPSESAALPILHGLHPDTATPPPRPA